MKNSDFGFDGVRVESRSLKLRVSLTVSFEGQEVYTDLWNARKLLKALTTVPAAMALPTTAQYIFWR